MVISASSYSEQPVMLSDKRLFSFCRQPKAVWLLRYCPFAYPDTAGSLPALADVEASSLESSSCFSAKMGQLQKREGH